MTITATQLKTVERSSRALRNFFIFLCPFVVLGMYYKIVNPSPAGTRTLAGVAFQLTSLTGKIQILWLVQVVLGAALTVKVLYHLIRLLGLCAKGKLFTAQNVAQIRQAGLTLMCAPAIWLVGLAGAASEIAAVQAQWMKIMPSFPLGTLVTGCLFLFASRIVNEARKLRDEQDLVI